MGFAVAFPRGGSSSTVSRSNWNLEVFFRHYWNLIIIIIIIMGFAVAFPRGGSSSTVSRSNWNLVVLVFDERGKPEYPEKNFSEHSREPTTNSTHI